MPYQPPASGDDWAVSRAPPPQPAAPPPRSAPPVGTGPVMQLSRDIPIAPNDNPIMQAAAPLLLLLGRLRASLMSAQFSNLIEQVATAIDDFDRQLRAAGVSEDHLRVAKYSLCATADDIVQNIPSEDRSVWTQYSMLSQFFGERTGGVRFFEELERMKRDPYNSYDVLELQYACLSMGFQGRHRTSSGTLSILQQEQRNLYEILRKVRPRVATDLSPYWQGQALPAAAARLRIPFWAVGSVAAVVLFSIYLTYRFLLAGNADAVAADLGRLTPEAQMMIDRPVPVVAAPPPPRPVLRTSQLERMRGAVSQEIGAGQVSVDPAGQSIVVRIGAFASFASGQATVLEPFVPVAARLGAMLEKEKGAIQIIGHTDSTPIRNTRFPSNFELSQERARAVAALIRAQLSDPSRITIEGKGSDQPIASNETAQGRALNRRVEILVPRED